MGLGSFMLEEILGKHFGDAMGIKKHWYVKKDIKTILCLKV